LDNVLVYPRIWWREPCSNVPLQHITCTELLVSRVNNGGMRVELTSKPVHVARKFLHPL